MENKNLLLGDIDTRYQKILLKYTKETKVEACFWKCFLECCGHWVMDMENNANIEKENQNAHLLYICTENELPEKINGNYIYLIQSLRNENAINLQENMFYLDWENRNSFKKVLPVLDKDHNLAELLDIFLDTCLWEAMWLHSNRFENIYKWDEKCRHTNFWVEEVVKPAKKAKKRLKEIDEKNYSAQYMFWYCEYLESSYTSRELKQWKKLIELRKINISSHAPLNYLSAKLDNLNFGKSTYNFLLNIPLEERTNEVVTNVLNYASYLYGDTDAIKMVNDFFLDWRKKRYRYFTEENIYIPLIYCKNISEYRLASKDEYILKYSSDKRIESDLRIRAMIGVLYSKITEDYISTEDILYFFRCEATIDHPSKKPIELYYNFLDEIEKQKGFKNLVRRMTPPNYQEQRLTEISDHLRYSKYKY